MWERARLTACLAVLPFAATVAAAADAPTTSSRREELVGLSLESLMEIEVTTASKRPESLKQTAAAVSVLTNEDLRRSGARTVADALRYVPGINVAHTDANSWAVSSRGFNDIFANKLLVMIDGRTIYTPLFSGVFWSEADVLLEDVERVEVVRGPGASLWGANAVNGVINIITRRAEDTAGGHLEGGGGNVESGFAAGRYGAQIAKDTWARIYFKYDNHNPFHLPNGTDAYDAWDKYQGGFRLDWKLSDRANITVQGDALHASLDQIFTQTSAFPPFALPIEDRLETEAGNVLARLTCELDGDAALTIQTYVDSTVRDSLFLREERTTFDLDAQHSFPWGDRQRLVWGLGYRMSDDNLRGNPSLSFHPADRRTDLASAFLHDEIDLVEERLRLTIGARFEYNDFTGFELQPNLRLLWTLHPDHTLWASISRAVRTPSRAEDGIDLRQPTGIPGILTLLQGNPDYDSESLVAYELGYNATLHTRLSLSLSLFYNDYEDVRSLQPLPAHGTTPVLLPLLISNLSSAETYGLEIAPAWQINDWWRVQAGYSLLRLHFHDPPASKDPSGDIEEGQSPQQQFSLWSRLNLPHNVDLDLGVRFVDQLPSFDVPGYTELDLRLAWRPGPRWEISFVAQNMLDPQHPEFGNTFLVTSTSDTRRSLYGKVSWRF